jgi:hypothetical protein
MSCRGSRTSPTAAVGGPLWLPEVQGQTRPALHHDTAASHAPVVAARAEERRCANDRAQGPVPTVVLPVVPRLVRPRPGRRRADLTYGRTQCGCPSWLVSRHTYAVPPALNPTQPSSPAGQNAPGRIAPAWVGVLSGGGGCSCVGGRGAAWVGGGATCVGTGLGELDAGEGEGVGEAELVVVGDRPGAADNDEPTVTREGFGAGLPSAPASTVPTQHRLSRPPTIATTTISHRYRTGARTGPLCDTALTVGPRGASAAQQIGSRCGRSAEPAPETGAPSGDHRTAVTGRTGDRSRAELPPNRTHTASTLKGVCVNPLVRPAPGRTFRASRGCMHPPNLVRPCVPSASQASGTGPQRISTCASPSL